LVLLVLGKDMPGLLHGVIIGILVLGLALSAARFFLRRQAAAILWGIYSYAYDGLLSFYPYTDLLARVSKRVEAVRPKTILDAGCGTGNLSRRLAAPDKELKIIAVDSSKGMLRRARSKLRNDNNIKLMDSGVMEYFDDNPSQKFDVITLINVLYAIEDRKVFWKEALSHLAPGGRLIVTNSDRGGSWPIIKDHLRHSSFLKLLRPSLLAVFVIDLFITQLASSGKFHFIGLDELEPEINRAGGVMSDVERCYGGQKDGVNLLFTVTAKR
jgi:ubiquinone/menaquinone biosynthesis C-methylase UbiE